MSFGYVCALHSPEDVAGVSIERQPLWKNRTGDQRPCDTIGDVHGCYDGLIELLNTFGYETTAIGRVVPPADRKAIFLDDLLHSVRTMI